MRCHQIQEGIEITANFLHFLFHSFKNMDSHGGLFKGDVAASVFPEGQPTALDLPRTLPRA